MTRKTELPIIERIEIKDGFKRYDPEYPQMLVEAWFVLSLDFRTSSGTVQTSEFLLERNDLDTLAEEILNQGAKLLDPDDGTSSVN